MTWNFSEWKIKRVPKCMCHIGVFMDMSFCFFPNVHARTCFVCCLPSVFCPTCCSGGMKLSAPSAEDSDEVPLRTTNNKRKGHHCCPFVALETELCPQQGERWENMRRDGMNVAGLLYRRWETQAEPEISTCRSKTSKIGQGRGRTSTKKGVKDMRARFENANNPSFFIHIRN